MRPCRWACGAQTGAGRTAPPPKAGNDKAEEAHFLDLAPTPFVDKMDNKCFPFNNDSVRTHALLGVVSDGDFDALGALFSLPLADERGARRLDKVFLNGGLTKDALDRYAPHKEGGA